jgi:hypothetical protein
MEPVTGTVRSIRAPLSRWVFLLLLLVALPMAGCNSGDECDTCSTDEDCEAGFVCSTFSDGSQRCGSGLGASTCKVR